ncbi:MAG TPA: hypothetical protein PKD68_01070 [Candidatus Saccharibacteria bacterium]|nr:hypothetical protein [Candidatus Saccharibacteria bacterium]
MKQPLSPQQSDAKETHTHTWRLIRAGLFSCLLLALSVVALLQRQQIADQLAVWQFQPSTQLESVAKRAGLNETGVFYLHASQAAIVDKEAFNQACGSLQSEQTVVIGCYTSPERRIYVYNVTDEQLDGVIETTTAHEMLHAAFDRLGERDRQTVTRLLEAEEEKITDSRLLQLIESYKKTEPNEVINELHSIIGTEVATISPELESYYARYFSDRVGVVSLKEKYESVFTDLADKQESLVRELEASAGSINTRQAAYTAALQQLNADIEQFNKWAKANTASYEEFTSRREQLEQRISALEQERVSLNTTISTYNKKKVELDALNVRAADLNQSINSKLAPTPSL